MRAHQIVNNCVCLPDSTGSAADTEYDLNIDSAAAGTDWQHLEAAATPRHQRDKDGAVTTGRTAGKSSFRACFTHHQCINS